MLPPVGLHSLFLEPEPGDVLTCLWRCELDFLCYLPAVVLTVTSWKGDNFVPFLILLF